MVDNDLLGQAVNCIYDNAAKYSFDDTRVDISGGVTGSGNFQISIASTGLEIRQHEISNCMERGWRSDDTWNVSGEGSGIGLWIVKHIMQAHKGHLSIMPTTPDDLTGSSMCTALRLIAMLT